MKEDNYWRNAAIVIVCIFVVWGVLVYVENIETKNDGPHVGIVLHKDCYTVKSKGYFTAYNVTVLFKKTETINIPVSYDEFINYNVGEEVFVTKRFGGVSGEIVEIIIKGRK